MIGGATSFESANGHPAFSYATLSCRITGHTEVGGTDVRFWEITPVKRRSEEPPPASSHVVPRVETSPSDQPGIPVDNSPSHQRRHSRPARGSRRPLGRQCESGINRSAAVGPIYRKVIDVRRRAIDGEVYRASRVRGEGVSVLRVRHAGERRHEQLVVAADRYR